LSFFQKTSQIGKSTLKRKIFLTVSITEERKLQRHLHW